MTAFEKLRYFFLRRTDVAVSGNTCGQPAVVIVEQSMRSYGSVWFAGRVLSKDFKCLLDDVHAKVGKIIEEMGDTVQARSILTRSARSHWIPIIVAFFVLLAVYQYIYATWPGVPGNDPNHPLGWWGGFDQGLYLKSSIAFSKMEFSADKHVYLPLYPFLGSLLLFWSPQNSYYLPDLLLMLGFAGFFLGFASRYVGMWLAVGALLAGMVVFEPLRQQWIIPWTSTLSAFLVVGALFLLDRHVRLRSGENFRARSAALNAVLFGLALGLQAATRAIDLIVMAPMALVYALVTVRGIIFFRAPLRFREIAGATAGAIGFLVPFLGWLAFNHAVYGTVIGGPYFAAAEQTGFWPLDLGEKIFSQILCSQIFYGERGADWASHLPILALTLAFLPTAIFLGPVVFRVAAVVALVQFALYYSYSDIIPTGTFRFHNIHYFKWLAPVTFAIAAYFLRGLWAADPDRRRESRLGVAVAAALAFTSICVTASYSVSTLTVLNQEGRNVLVESPGAELDFIDFEGVSGSWRKVYFANSSVALDGGRLLRFPRDYRLLPIRGGARLLFVRPVLAQKVELDLGEDLHFAEPLTGLVHGVSVRFGLGLPLSQRWAPATTGSLYMFPYTLGRSLDFAADGSAEDFLLGGWSTGESWGRWIDGGQGEIGLKLTQPVQNDVILQLVAVGFIAGPAHPETTAEIYANRCLIDRFRLENGERHDVVLRIPARCVSDTRDLRLSFRNLSPASPKLLGLSSDPRRLGLGVVSLRLDSALSGEGQ